MSPSLGMMIRYLFAGIALYLGTDEYSHFSRSLAIGLAMLLISDAAVIHDKLKK